MFSGIVEETGRVIHLDEGPESWILKVSAVKVQKEMTVGDSVAVNGCCLTVTTFDSNTVTFDLLNETLTVTSFEGIKENATKNQSQYSGTDVIPINIQGNGTSVNLECSLRFDGKIGGHFLTGHIDTVGQVIVIERRGKDCYMRIEPPPDTMRYIVNKGNIAIDGVSLTVAEVDKNGFAVWLIPHTLKVTNFHERQTGDTVNLEFDILSKYVEKLIAKS